MRVLSSLVIAMALTAPMLASAADTAKPLPGTGKNVVIVPGSFVDGSGWRVVRAMAMTKEERTRIKTLRTLLLTG